MGKRISVLMLGLTAAFAWAIPGTAPVHAADGDNQVQVEIAGKPALTFEREPFIEQGTTLVQFRPVFEAMGLTVGWDQEQHKVTGDRRGVHIELTIDSTIAAVNGEVKQLEQAPRLIDGSTYVPLRFIGEASEYEVDWKEASKEVLLVPTDVTQALDAINDGSLQFVTNDGSVPEDGVWNGTGRLINGAGQTVYEGELRNGSLEGQGTLQVNNLPFYTGGWKNDRFDGTGKLYRNGKVEYEGGFANGKKQGSGKQYNEDGQLTYAGNYVAGNMEGNGAFYYASAGTLKYEGEVKDNQENGQGKEYYLSGRVYYDGAFKEGKKEGLGKLYDENGKLMYEGPFKDDKQVNSFASMVTDRIKKLHDWKQLQTGYLTVYYYSDDDVVKTAAPKLDAIVKNVRSNLGDHTPKMEPGATKIPVYILTPADFKKDLNIPYDSVVAQWYDTTMFLSLRPESNSMYRFFQHEMVHATTVGSVDLKAEDVPIWFTEGIAMYHEFDPPYTSSDQSRENAMRYVVRENKRITWSGISGLASSPVTEEQLQISYAEGWSIYDYLARKYGEANIAQIFYQSGKFSNLLQKATGKTLEELESDWTQYVESRFQ